MDSKEMIKSMKWFMLLGMFWSLAMVGCCMAYDLIGGW